MNFALPETWVLVAFLIFVGFTAKRIYVYIIQLTDRHTQNISAQLTEATRLHDEALSLLETYKTKHETALQHAEEILALAEKEIEAFKESHERAYTDFKKQREKLFQERLDLQKKEIISKLQGETMDEALKIVEKVLARDKKVRQNVTKEAIDEIREHFLT